MVIEGGVTVFWLALEVFRGPEDGNSLSMNEVIVLTDQSAIMLSTQHQYH